MFSTAKSMFQTNTRMTRPCASRHTRAAALSNGILFAPKPQIRGDRQTGLVSTSQQPGKTMEQIYGFFPNHRNCNCSARQVQQSCSVSFSFGGMPKIFFRNNVLFISLARVGLAPPSASSSSLILANFRVHSKGGGHTMLSSFVPEVVWLTPMQVSRPFCPHNSSCAREPFASLCFRAHANFVIVFSVALSLSVPNTTGHLCETLRSLF